MHLLSQLFSHCPPLVHTCSSFILTQVFCSRTTSHVEVKLCVAVQLDFDHWLVSSPLGLSDFCTFLYLGTPDQASDKH